MDYKLLLPYLVFGTGVLCKIFVPWLVVRRENPNMSWSWRYIWPQLITALLVAMVLPLVFDMGSVASMALPAAYLAGWGAADVGRVVDKVVITKVTAVVNHK